MPQASCSQRSRVSGLSTLPVFLPVETQQWQTMQLRTFRNSGQPFGEVIYGIVGIYKVKSPRNSTKPLEKHPSLTFSSCDLRTYQTPSL